MDKIIKAVNATKEYSITTCITTDIMKQIVKNQKLVTGFSNSVSDIVTSAVLMTNSMKDAKEEVGISLRTNGMLSQIVANGSYNGDFNGYGVMNASPTLSERIIGSEGVLEVYKYYDGKEVRNSIINVESNNISDIIVDYYFQSEQVYSVVILASLTDKKTDEFYASGGILIQLLPNASEETIDKINEVVSNLNNVSHKIAMGMSAEELVTLIDKQANILEEKPIQFNCKCSRENTLSSLRSIDKSDIERIIREDGELKVICNACNKVYIYNIEDFDE